MGVYSVYCPQILKKYGECSIVYGMLFKDINHH